MLTRDKPNIPKGYKNLLRKNKWNHSDEVVSYFRNLKISVIIFDKSTSTPHLRIGDTLDYWPATTRFFLFKQRLWGIGYEALKQVFSKNKEQEKPNINLSAKIKIQQKQIELEFKQALIRDRS